MPIHDYLCNKCGHEFEAFTSPGDTGKAVECRCGEYADRLPSTFGGYAIRGDNSASRTPKGAGSFKKERK